MAANEVEKALGGRNGRLKANDIKEECRPEQDMLPAGQVGAIKGAEGMKVLNKRPNSPLELTDQGVCAINLDARVSKIVILDEMTKESASHLPKATEEEAGAINPNARGSKLALMENSVCEGKQMSCNGTW